MGTTVTPPPSQYSFDITITPINERYALMIDSTGTIAPVVININQPQELLRAFGQLALSGLSTLTSQPTFAWIPGTWRISVEHVEVKP